MKITPAHIIAIVGLSAVIPSFAAEQLTKRSLFNGTDLTGWKGEGYTVQNGTIICQPKIGKTLITEETFANYILEFEFLLTPGANNGLGIHYPGTGDSAYTGMEIQILDSTAEKYKNLKDYQFHGGLYTMKAAKQGALKPVGEWNFERVTVNGSSLKVELNGETILEANLDEMSEQFPEHQGVKRRAGHIGWLGHGDEVAFRNIQIAELPPTGMDAILQQTGFQKLFDGTSFKGWKHPDSATNWSIANGILKHNGQAGTVTDLWTEKPYKDFTLVFDWRWSARGPMKHQPVVAPDGSQSGSVEIEEQDSGIYLRGSSKSQVNLWNWNVGSGEVYGYRTDAKMPADIRAAVTPKVKADRPMGEWNRMMITVRGDQLKVAMNQQVIIDNATLPGIPNEGPIALQHHNSAIDFANIWIKEN